MRQLLGLFEIQHLQEVFVPTSSNIVPPCYLTNCDSY